MKKLCLGIIALIIVMSGVVFAHPKNNHKYHINLEKKNILVAYYSLSGNTKFVAERIHSQTGGDLFEIVTKTKYPTEKRLLTEVARYQNENNIYPEIKNTVDVSKYDVIFIGTPVWFSTMAMPVKTFLTQNNFKNKYIIPFITSGSGDGYDIDVDIDDITNGKVVSNMLVIKNKGSDNIDKEIKNWLKSLKK